MISNARKVLLLVLALACSPAWAGMVGTVEAGGPVDSEHAVTLRGPSYSFADQVGSYSGSVRLRAVAAGLDTPALVGSPGTPVALELDGKVAATGRTNNFGSYWIDMAIATPGEHVVVAVVGRGTPDEARSPPLLVFVPSAPDAPTALAATVGPAWDEVSVSWSEPIDDGGAQVRRYDVHRATSASGPFTFLGSTDAATRAWLDAPGVAGDLVYAVVAVNDAGESPPVQTLLPASLPSSPPTELSATNGPIWDDVGLAWAAPVDTGGAPLAGYVVERARLPDGAFEERASVSASTTAFADTGESNVSYAYRVSALTRAGAGEPAEVEVHVPEEPVLDSLSLSMVRFRVCDASGCSTVSAGGTAWVWDNVHHIEVELEGAAAGERLDEVEVEGEVAMIVPTTCDSGDVCVMVMDEIEVAFAIRPSDTGALSARVGTWTEGVARGHCEEYDFGMWAGGGTLSVSDSTTLRVCR